MDYPFAGTLVTVKRISYVRPEIEADARGDSASFYQKLSLLR